MTENVIIITYIVLPAVNKSHFVFHIHFFTFLFFKIFTFALRSV